MKKTTKNRVPEFIRKGAGKNLSFAKLCKAMNEDPERDKWLWECARYFTSEEVPAGKGWEKLRDTFLRKYLPEILEQLEPYIEMPDKKKNKLVITGTYEFLLTFVYLIMEEVIQGDSPYKLARHIKSCCSIKMGFKTLQNELNKLLHS